MPPKEKLVDADFLENLLAGSYETSVGVVEGAIGDHAELFGGTDDVQVRSLGTYAEHVIVANENGEFYRAKWKIDETKQVVFSAVEKIDVPTTEATYSASKVRDTSNRVVDALMGGNMDEAVEGMSDLVGLVFGGAPLTAESVEHLYEETKSSFADSEWLQAIKEHGDQIRKSVGADAYGLQGIPTKFASVIALGESEVESHRSSVIESLRSMKGEIARLSEKIVLGKVVTESYRIRDSKEDSSQQVADFVRFSRGFEEDLDSLSRVLDDAVAIAEDGNIRCLARIHDSIAEGANDWILAATFVSNFARRLEAPNKAA